MKIWPEPINEYLVLPEEIRKAVLKFSKKWSSFTFFSHEIKIPRTTLKRILDGKRTSERNIQIITHYYNRKIFRQPRLIGLM